MAAREFKDEDVKKKKRRRHYISLCGGEDEYVDEEEDFDLDSFDRELDGYDEEWDKRSKKEILISDICFFSGLFIIVSLIIGAVVLLGRVITYPFVKKFAKDCDW